MYCDDYTINDFKIGIGDCPWNQSIILDLTNEKIVQGIKNKDPNLMEAIFTAQYHSKELDAINFFQYQTNFTKENFNWSRYFVECDYNGNFQATKSKASIILCGEIANEDVRQSARIFLNACDGDYPKYIPTEHDLKIRKQNRYRDSKAKWLRLLVESVGYKCTKCECNKDLRIKHLVSIMKGGETELSNLEFRCTKHINAK